MPVYHPSCQPLRENPGIGVAPALRAVHLKGGVSDSTDPQVCSPKLLFTVVVRPPPHGITDFFSIPLAPSSPTPLSDDPYLPSYHSTITPSQDKWVKGMTPLARWVRAAGLAAVEAIEQLESTGQALTWGSFKCLEGMIPPDPEVPTNHPHHTPPHQSRLNAFWSLYIPPPTIVCLIAKVRKRRRLIFNVPPQSLPNLPFPYWEISVRMAKA